jgi:predicted nucleic acid-binding protein
LNRAEARKLLPGINDRIVNAFLSKLEAKAILIINVPEEFHYDRDPDDEMYINFAIVADATYLVSRDKDLLDLMTTSKDVARQFRLGYPFLRIIKAADFITTIESANRVGFGSARPNTCGFPDSRCLIIVCEILRK